jgi:hypothetical protein
MVTITGGTVPITGFSLGSGGTSANITGGTSYAGTGGTRDISLTLINSGQTDGVNVNLLNAFSFENDNAVKVTVGGVSAGTAPFSAATSIHEIIQQIFYPRIAPTYSPQRDSSLILNPSTLLFEVNQKIPTLVLNSTFTRGIYTGGIYQKIGGLPTSYVYSGPDISPSVTATTSNLTNSYTLNNYSVSLGYNIWTLQVNYGEGDIPVYDTNEPYPVPLFTNSGFTTSTDRFEGVYPLFANSQSVLTKTQQPLYSMLVKNPSSNGSGAATSLGGIVIYFNQGDTNESGIYIEIPRQMITNLGTPLLQVYSATQNYVTVTDWIETNTTNVINDNTINYVRYTWDIKLGANLFGARYIRINF